MANRGGPNVQYGFGGGSAGGVGAIDPRQNPPGGGTPGFYSTLGRGLGSIGGGFGFGFALDPRKKFLLSQLANQAAGGGIVGTRPGTPQPPVVGPGGGGYQPPTPGYTPGGGTGGSIGGDGGGGGINNPPNWPGDAIGPGQPGDTGRQVYPNHPFNFLKQGLYNLDQSNPNDPWWQRLMENTQPTRQRTPLNQLQQTNYTLGNVRSALARSRASGGLSGGFGYGPSGTGPNDPLKKLLMGGAY